MPSSYDGWRESSVHIASTCASDLGAAGSAAPTLRGRPRALEISMAHGEYALAAADLRPGVGAAAEAVNLAELAGGSTVWLAVTGLSRSGKTVFITSLIHNLLSSLHNPNRMPLLDVVGERRLIAARLEGAKATGCRAFPMRTISSKMAGRRTGRSAPPTSARSASRSASRRPTPSGKLLSEITRQPRDLDHPRSSTIPANGCSICRC